VRAPAFLLAGVRGQAALGAACWFSCSVDLRCGHSGPPQAAC
jgi:hypothetical protein